MLMLLNTRPILALYAKSVTSETPDIVNSKNFYIIATAPNEPSLQVNISGPYLTEQAAKADLEAAIDEARDIDPCAERYDYSISRIECRKPGVIQHMASHA